MDESALRELWSRTLGPTVELESLPTHVTYKPLDFDIGVENTPLASASGRWQTLDPMEEIGRGGMGIVYRAKQSTLKREVALKTLRSKEKPSATLREAFLAEAYTTGRLEHPNIVPVYELGESTEGELFLAMKLVGGRSWLELLRGERKTDLLFNLDVLLQVCNAVAFAHSRGIVHNDLKPANVMVGAFGEVLLMDWGLAVSFVHTESTANLRYRTTIKDPCGTPSYMAPELAEGRGEDVGPWTDIYLLGALLYRILAAKPPHRGSDFIQVIIAAALSRPPRFPDTAPEALAAICRKAMAADPEERYEDVQSFQQALRDYLQHRESLEIAGSAQRRLEECREEDATVGSDRRARIRLYDGFTRALAGFEQALELWPENPIARDGVDLARAAYAEAALHGDDLGLAEQQASGLEEGDERAALVARIASARREKRRALSAARRLRIALAVALTMLIGGLSTGLWIVLGQKAEIAEKSEALAEAKGIAESRQDIAVDALEQMTYHLQRELRARRDEGEYRALAERFLAIAQEGWNRLGAAELEEERISVGGIATLQRIGDLELELDLDPQAALERYALARERARQLFAEDSSSVPTRRALVAAELGIGKARRTLGEVEAAHGAFHRALQLCEAGGSDKLADVGLMVEACTHLGLLELQRNQLDSALAFMNRSLALREELVAREPDQFNHLWNRTVSLSRLGSIYSELGRNDEARRVMEECLEARRALRRSTPWSSILDSGLGAILRMLGNEHLQHGRYDEARACYDEALALRRGLVARSPESVKARFNLAVALGNLADVELGEEAIEEAADLLAEAQAVLHELNALHAGSPELTREINLGRDRLGDVARALGDHTGALALYSAALPYREGSADADPSNARAQRDLYISHERIARCHHVLGAMESARDHIDRGLERLCRVFARDADNARVGNDIYYYLERLDELLPGGPREAATHGVRQARAIAEELDTLPARRALLRWLMIEMELAQADGALEDCLRMCLEGIELSRGSLTADPQRTDYWSDLATCLGKAAELHSLLGQPAAAESFFIEARTVLRKLVEETDDPFYAEALANIEIELGLMELARGEEEAPASITRGLDLWRARGRADAERAAALQLRLRRVAMVLKERGEVDAALPLFEEAVVVCRLFTETRAQRRDLALSLLRWSEALRLAGDLQAGAGGLEEARGLALALTRAEEAEAVDWELLALIQFEGGAQTVLRGDGETGVEMLAGALSLYAQLTEMNDGLRSNLIQLTAREGELVAAAWEAGQFVPRTGPGHARLARALHAVDRFEESALAYHQAFQDPETWYLEDFYRATRSAARALAESDDPETSAFLAELGRAWLGAVLDALREDIARIETDPAFRARSEELRGMWAYYLEGDELARLREEPGVRELFAPDPWR